MHVDDDVAVFVLDGVQRQGRVFLFREDGAEDGCHAFDDAEVELRLRDELGEFGEDEADLGAGDFEGNAVVEEGWVLQGGRFECSFFRSANVYPNYS